MRALKIFLMAVAHWGLCQTLTFWGLFSTLSSQRSSVSHTEEGSTLSPVYKSILLFSPQLWRTPLIFSWIERIIQHFLFLSKTEKKRRLFISCQNVDERPLLFACLHVKTLRYCSQPGLHTPGIWFLLEDWLSVSGSPPELDIKAGMPGASGVNVEGSCEALCQTLVSQNGIQRETADISQSVLYTSLMGLLLVADNKVRKACHTNI